MFQPDNIKAKSRPQHPLRTQELCKSWGGDFLGSPSLIVRTVSVDLKQQLIWTASTFRLQPLWSGPSKSWSALSVFSVAKCLRVKPASPPSQSASSWPRSTAQRYTCLWMCLCLVGTESGGGGGGGRGHSFLGSALLCEYSGTFLLINQYFMSVHIEVILDKNKKTYNYYLY